MVENNISLLGNKYTEKVFTYDMVGTSSMLLYNQNERNLYVMTKEGVLLTVTNTGIEFTYEQFINQARDIYVKTLDRADGKAFEYQTGLS